MLQKHGAPSRNEQGHNSHLAQGFFMDGDLVDTGYSSGRNYSKS